MSGFAADDGNVSQVTADGGNVPQLAANLHTLAPVNDHTNSSTGSRADSTPLTDRPKGRLSVILERELRYCADVPINGPICGDKNLAERCVWIPYVEAHTSCDQMERAPGASWQKALRRCRADFSVRCPDQWIYLWR